jgi:hypothetical protein
VAEALKERGTRTETSIGVVGAAVHLPRAKRRSLDEAMSAVPRSALADAGVAIEDYLGADDRRHRSALYEVSFAHYRTLLKQAR